MAENKTQATAASVDAYLAAIADERRRADCERLVDLMRKVTGCAPVMWGPGIVGFDRYHYRYESGREGDMCVTGFSSRKTDLSIYLISESPGQPALLARLGKHKMGKSCLGVKRLADIDLQVLERLVAESVAETKRRYG